ncbi:hypothetical protein [Cyclobacterium xiamenense]|uniref:hypothetical protein n=1 Tax=Cyclobacterium xiamenense TaxID=1297121 RepID=UPI0012B8F7D7|nr:hypothetical protein [Cyclobacterium xiamenense]
MHTLFTFLTFLKSRLFLLLLWAGLSATGVQAQQYTLGTQAGLFTSIDYGRYASARLGFFTGLSFDYRFPGKLSLGSHYQFGTFSYAPNQGGQMGLPENSSVQVHLIYWTFQRHFSLGGDWNLAVGTGPGFFLARYPDERDGQTGLPVFSRDFSMPLLLNLSKPLGNFGTVGVKSGLFFTPFYAIGGFHFGPEIRFRF